jgi:hypothetical protein
MDKRMGVGVVRSHREAVRREGDRYSWLFVFMFGRVVVV